jgi:hypothetical protein
MNSIARASWGVFFVAACSGTMAKAAPISVEVKTSGPIDLKIPALSTSKTVYVETRAHLQILASVQVQKETKQDPITGVSVSFCSAAYTFQDALTLSITIDNESELKSYTLTKKLTWPSDDSSQCVAPAYPQLTGAMPFFSGEFRVDLSSDKALKMRVLQVKRSRADVPLPAGFTSVAQGMSYRLEYLSLPVHRIALASELCDIVPAANGGTELQNCVKSFDQSFSLRLPI